MAVGAEGGEPVSVTVDQRWHLYRVTGFADVD